MTQGSKDPLLGVLVGRYRLGRRLGAGGMGAVYEGVDATSGLSFAVKVVMHDALNDPELLPRSLREAKLTLGLSGSYIVPTLDAGQDAALGCVYLVMPLLVGADVDTVLEREGALVEEAAVRIALQACRGLNEVHAAGIVHRDVKPSNLFLEQQSDGTLRVRILDFGLGKKQVATGATRITTSGRSFGSPFYMSPEQLRDPQDVDVRSDVYSLAVVLFELLTGQVPFGAASSVGDLFVTVCTTDAPRARDVAAWVHRGLDEILARALSRDRDQRPPTARAFAELLLPFVKGSRDGEPDTLTQGMLMSRNAPTARVAPAAPVLPAVGPQPPPPAPPPPALVPPPPRAESGDAPTVPRLAERKKRRRAQTALVGYAAAVVAGAVLAVVVWVLVLAPK